MIPRVLGIALLLCCAPALALVHPPIGEIAFEGNDTTQPKIMLREMEIEVGDPADPEAIERSRQAVLDLGLFNSVRVREEALPGGALRLVFVVEEKWYLLPTPRLDIKSDGTNAYGAQLRWANFLGLNHSLRVYWQSSDRQRQNIGRETTWQAGYAAPFIFDSPYGFSAGAGYTTRPVLGDAGEFTEQFQNANVYLTRSLNEDGPPSQGWSVAAGLLWLDQDTRGAFAPAPYGSAIAPVMTAGYRDLHFNVYSESGVSYGARVETAQETLGSDYDYALLSLGYAGYRPVGSTPHQTVHLFAGFGTYHGGPPGTRAFGLGGASELRGYEANFIEGDLYYRVATEFARPVLWRWLRAVVILEAGNVFEDPGDFRLDEIYASLGVGLRVRLPMFVNFEVEAGYAIPLDGGAGRIFASRV